MSDTPDWRLPVLEGASAVDVPAAGRNPIAWPGYTPRQAVGVWRLRSGIIAAVWDFGVFGGSFGEDDATALVAAAREAVRLRVPLLTLVRWGGTRLQEGVAALVGIPRARLALLELAEARLPHLSVADAPTTGGVVCRRSGRRRRDIGGRPTPEGYRLAARGYRLADRLGIPVLSLVDTPGADPGPAAEKAGLAPAIGEALDALLTCRAPTLALVHGEGGSGGAVAAAAADLVLMTPDAYLAAIGPEGAAATLRRPPPQCADLLRLTPADSLALGVVDAIVTPSPAEVARRLRGLVAEGPERVQRRQVRWSATVPFAL